MQGTLKHLTTSKYWSCYHSLPENIRNLADKNFNLLKTNTHHPSLHYKKIKDFISVRIGSFYRALGVETPENNDIIWFWIGDHNQYEKLLKK